MKANKNKQGEIIVGIPTQWYRKDTPHLLTEMYNVAFTEADYAYDGWVDYVPAVPTETQKKDGYKAIYNENNELIEVTDNVVDLTPQEIESKLISKSEAARQAIIDENIRKQNEAIVDAEFQAIEDEEELLSNIDAFPLWTVGEVYSLNKKIKYVVDGEMKLFKVNQPTLTADELYPPGSEGTAALYTEVSPPGVVPVFVQPTGAHDAYGLDDLVHFPTENDPIYKSLIAANVYSPTTYPQGWQIQE